MCLAYHQRRRLEASRHSWGFPPPHTLDPGPSSSWADTPCFWAFLQASHCLTCSSLCLHLVKGNSSFKSQPQSHFLKSRL